MTNTEWKEYNGSKEQIAEMESAQYGVLLSSNPQEIVDVSDMISLESYLSVHEVTHYLICNPHPLADMICQQARTGQPVWVRIRCSLTSSARIEDCREWWLNNPPTTAPDWNLKAEYSFIPFGVEV